MTTATGQHQRSVFESWCLRTYLRHNARSCKMPDNSLLRPMQLATQHEKSGNYIKLRSRQQPIRNLYTTLPGERGTCSSSGAHLEVGEGHSEEDRHALASATCKQRVASVAKEEMQELFMRNEPACAKLSAGPTVEQSSS